MKKVLPKILKHMVLLILLFFALYPVFMVVSNSLKTQAELYKNTLGLPQTPQFQNYAEAIRSGKLGNAFFVTLLLTVISVVLITILGSFAAFALSRRRRTRSGKLLYQLMILGMMIPYQVSMFQLYRLMDKLHLINHLYGLVFVYIAWGLPLTVYLMYGFMCNIPNEIIEAAKIDGCSLWHLSRRIVMPLSTTVVASSVIFNLVFVWNDLNFPMILIDDPNLKTLSNALLSFRGQYSSQYTLLFAGVVLASIPLVTVFLLLQKKFTAGMMAGSVKG